MAICLWAFYIFLKKLWHTIKSYLFHILYYCRACETDLQVGAAVYFCVYCQLRVCICPYSSKLLQELRQEAACCLGLLCAALSYEAERIFKWMFMKFSSCTKDEVKLLYLVAMYKALETAGEKKAFSPVMQVLTTQGFSCISSVFNNDTAYSCS